MLNGSSLNMFIHWGFVGAAKISIARPNLFGHYTVVQNPCLPVPRPQNQLQSTRYLANPELTRTSQNTRYKISAHFPSFLQNHHDWQQDQSLFQSSRTLFLFYFSFKKWRLRRQLLWRGWKQNNNLFQADTRTAWVDAFEQKSQERNEDRSRRDEVIENGLHKYYSRITCYI